MRRNPRITRYGTIRGGMCDRAHNDRAGRERGAYKALSKLNETKCIEWKNEKGKVTKNLSSYWNWRRISKFLTGNEEIGWHRFIQDVVPLLIESKRHFTWKQLIKCTKDIASFEFGVSLKDPSNDLAFLDLLEGDETAMSFGYCTPHADDIYQQKIKDGVIKCMN